MDGLELDKRKTGTRRSRSWPHVWLTTFAFACIGWRSSMLVYDSANVHNFLAPLHSRVPKLGTVPPPSFQASKRVRKLATFQPHPRSKPRPQTQSPPDLLSAIVAAPPQSSLGTPETTPGERAPSQQAESLTCGGSRLSKWEELSRPCPPCLGALWA